MNKRTVEQLAEDLIAGSYECHSLAKYAIVYDIRNILQGEEVLYKDDWERYSP